MIELQMDEDVAEIVLSALIIYLKTLREEDFADDEEMQEDVNYCIDKAQETASLISECLSQDEAMH